MKIFLLIIIALILCIGTSSASSIQWYDYKEGISIAEKTGKPMMIYFYSDYAPNTNFDDPEVIEALDKFICIKVNVNLARNLTKSNNIYGVPTIVFINTKKQEILRFGGIVTNLQSRISEAWNKKDEIGQPFQLLENEYEIEINDLGKVTIEEYNSKYKNLNLEKSANVELVIKAEINDATIRKLSGPSSNSYTLTLDDGTGTMLITYKGGLGDINIGDKVNIKIESNKITEISKSGFAVSQYKPTPSDDTSSKTTPGFGLIAGVFTVFVFYWRKKRD